MAALLQGCGRPVNDGKTAQSGAGRALSVTSRAARSLKVGSGGGQPPTCSQPPPPCLPSPRPPCTPSRMLVTQAWERGACRAQVRVRGSFGTHVNEPPGAAARQVAAETRALCSRGNQLGVSRVLESAEDKDCFRGLGRPFAACGGGNEEQRGTGRETDVTGPCLQGPLSLSTPWVLTQLSPVCLRPDCLFL